ncbi:PAS domain-containing protein [Flavobacterium sufflavum]|uniref:histidine kinase n=1 Tax=Flavobacterium sufflavum TaxID=1921138 RepID=A0A3S2U6L4_9FLAO|nr:ATP-binding protein [Flavobacterium sufflavum]RVT80040.1 PAS domain-containing protein [Flavobacterium sufflavum]
MKNDRIDFQKIFLSAPSLFLIVSTDLSILDLNDSYEKAAMKKREEMIGRNLFEVFPDNPEDKHADGVSNLSKSLHSVLKEKRPHTMAVQRYDVQGPDGIFEERYWCPINIPVLNSQNEIDYIIHRVEDVTEFITLKNKQSKTENVTVDLQKKVDEMEVEIIKRSREIQKLNFELEQKVKERTETILKREKTLAEQNEVLKRQNKELEQFTYITSHDLQEPLRSLVCFTELFEKEFSGKLDGNGDIYIDFISKSSRRMQDLVKGLLDYSRIGKEKQLGEADCAQIVKDVISDMSIILEESKAKISVDDLPELNGYTIELRQLFQNLISNAVKFRKKGVIPEIKITVQEEEKKWLFSIQDNSIGIDEKDMHKLFVIFKRLNNRDEYEGTGIGLAHCKKIVELHGGSIWAESKLGEGSIFKFTIQKL